VDIDLIAHGQDIAPSRAVFDQWQALSLEEQQQKWPQELILPHPRLQDRAFVLVPMAEVAPDWVHPVFGKTTLEMLNALPENLRKEVVRL
jgi:2-amino-4-hydroxy-6-hydroxymethyldihydropteridine diphosphokinase